MTSLNTTTSKLSSLNGSVCSSMAATTGVPPWLRACAITVSADVEADHERMAEQIAQPLDLATFATAEVEDPAHSPAWVRNAGAPTAPRCARAR